MGKRFIEYIKDYRLWLFIGALVLIFFLVYSPHRNYSYPLHVDEWHHISEARSLARLDYHFDSVSSFEVGYHLFLALLIKMGFNLVLIYKFLPSLFAILSAIVLFFLVFRITKNYYTSLFSIIFFAFLPSNVNLLGLWFATPLTFSIPFVLSCFLFLHISLNEQNQSKYFYLFSIFFFLLMITHAISAFFVFIISLVYIMLNYKNNKNEVNTLYYLIPLFILFLVIILFLSLSKENISWFLSKIMFGENWTLINLGVDTNPVIFNLGNYHIFLSHYFLPFLFGFIPFILALFGFYLTLKNKGLQLFGIWFLYGLVMIFLFVNFKISPLVPYQRVLYYSLISLCVLASVGLIYLINITYSKLNKKRFFYTLFIILVLIISFFSVIISYGKQYPGSELYYLMQKQDYRDLLELKKIVNNKLILAPLDYSTLIPALSDNRILADIYFVGSQEEREDIISFYSSDCTKKEEILNKYNLFFVYSPNSIKCSFLKESYFGNFYLYTYKDIV